MDYTIVFPWEQDDFLRISAFVCMYSQSKKENTSIFLVHF